jgi:hypothetical protein
MPWLCTPLAYAPGFNAGSTLNLWRFGTGARLEGPLQVIEGPNGIDNLLHMRIRIDWDKQV